jgi:hypothetical protein
VARHHVVQVPEQNLSLWLVVQQVLRLDDQWQPLHHHV